jgi:splicing factor U2AF 65 kDa subunit
MNPNAYLGQQAVPGFAMAPNAAYNVAMMMNQAMMPGMAASNSANEKIFRELFVGNTPPGTSELLLLHFLNSAMRRVNLCLPTETPILNCRVSNKFSFIELTSVEMTNRALNLNGIPFLGAVLKISRPSKYTGPIMPSQSWSQLTGQTTIVTPSGATALLLDPEQDKISRELFIGNTTPEMTEAMLREFLGNALQQVGLANPAIPGNPITAARVSGKFAFIELRSAHEATAALNLNNIPFMGTALRVGRPSKWTGPPDVHGNWEDILAKAMSGELNLLAQQQQQHGMMGAGTVPQQSLQAPSKIVQLQNMLTEEDLADPVEYEEILQDTRSECSQFGTLLQVVIPKPGQVGATKVFLQYANQQDASNAIQGLAGRTFDDRRVIATFYDEQRFANQDYA